MKIVLCIAFVGAWTERDGLRYGLSLSVFGCAGFKAYVRELAFFYTHTKQFGAILAYVGQRWLLIDINPLSSWSKK